MGFRSQHSNQHSSDVGGQSGIHCKPARAGETNGIAVVEVTSLIDRSLLELVSPR